jgi:hypothetical protein
MQICANSQIAWSNSACLVHPRRLPITSKFIPMPFIVFGLSEISLGQFHFAKCLYPVRSCPRHIAILLSSATSGTASGSRTTGSRAALYLTRVSSHLFLFVINVATSSGFDWKRDPWRQRKPEAEKHQHIRQSLARVVEVAPSDAEQKLRLA